VRRRRIGWGGFQVGAVGLGCMGMSWAYSSDQRDEKTSVAVIRRALDLGVTLVDTADVYGPFTNELLVGRALQGRREEVVLATKCGLVLDNTGVMSRNGHPWHVRRACDASLRRLQVEPIDLYQLHRVDPEVPVEDTWGAMTELVQAGKVRALGLSEVGVDELQRAQHVFPVTSVQSELSVWTRDALEEVLPWCRQRGVGFLAFSPLGRGFLTGALGGATFAADDFRARNPRFTTSALAANQRILDAVRRVATRRQATLAQVALAWVLAQGRQVVPIPGTKRLAYLEENAAAADIELDETDLALLDDAPAAVGARY